ncbi:RICIN domain-containing protein [Streptomyces sp. NPDC020965]|uniref:RICIN domain-containing protein n=1 Tax=Streptomyces sp. NPDC020965 TaxID=3365105 RepID=UPI0037A3D7FA
MTRTARMLAGCIAVAVTAVTTPVLAAPTTASAQPTSGASLDRLSPDEVRDLESRFPVQAKRVREAIAHSSGSGGVGTTAAEFYKIRNQNSGKCLAIGSSSHANGARAIQWDCLNSNAQVWVWGSEHLVNFNSGKYLAIGAGSIANGANAIQWERTGTAAQRWRKDGAHIINQNSRKFLAIGAGSDANGANAIQWDYTGTATQRWTWAPQ